MADSFEEGADAGVVVFDFALQFGEFSGEFFVGGEDFAQADEGAHDGDVDEDGAFGAQDAGEHGDALFGESVKRFAPTSMLRT